MLHRIEDGQPRCPSSGRHGGKPSDDRTVSWAHAMTIATTKKMRRHEKGASAAHPLTA